MDIHVKIRYGQDTVCSILLRGFKSIKGQRSTPTSRSDWNWSLALLTTMSVKSSVGECGWCVTLIPSALESVPLIRLRESCFPRLS